MKKEYLNIINAKLSEANIVNKETDMLRYLPEENLRKISEFDFSHITDLKSLYKEFREYGYFNFVPYIVPYSEEGDDNPSLCIGYGRFLHMFRGYYFQISGTPDGTKSYANSALRTDSLVRLASYYNQARKSKLVYMFLYANMIDCGFQDSNFRYTFMNHREVVDEFFKKSMKSWGINFDYDSSVFNDVIYKGRGYLTPKDGTETIYEFRKKNEPYCRFEITKDRVSVEYARNTSAEYSGSMIMSIRIPDVTEGIVDSNPLAKAMARMSGESQPDVDSTYAEELRYDIERVFDNDASVHHMILLMLLKFARIHACWYTIYPYQEAAPIKEFSDYKFLQVETCRDFISKVS